MGPIALVDTHIHLFRTSDLDQLAWMTPTNPLNGAHSVEEYSTAINHSSSPKYEFKGFIFVETDRKSTLEPSGWGSPINEFAFVHSTSSTHPLLGIVSWAPLPSGPQALETYHQKLQEAVRGEKMELLKGFRYLLQWVEPGFMLAEKLIEGLKWMGNRGLVFDLTVDCRSTGLWQLEEAVEMVRRTNGQVTIVLDHLGKPDLHIPPEDVLQHPSFLKWKKLLEEMAGLDNTYIKLSGAFSEVPEGLEVAPNNIDKIVACTKPWISAAIVAFGPGRAMWGSDWPVCTIRGGKKGAWEFWMEILEKVLKVMHLTEADREMIFAGTARKAYMLAENGQNSVSEKSRISRL